MKPSRTDEDALVDLLDVILRDGVVVEADVILSVADVPLVGVKLRAAIAGMTTMAEYGMFEEFDRRHRSVPADEAVGGSESVPSVETKVPEVEGGTEAAEVEGGTEAAEAEGGTEASTASEPGSSADSGGGQDR